MIEFIRLVDLGIIAEAEIDFGPGFTVITGETGAGKTMVLSALDLLLGGNTKQSLAKSEKTKVQGGWSIAVDEPLTRELAEADVELDDGLLLLTRSIPAGGRSKCLAGGSIVPQSKFMQWGEQLVAVHGQADQILLRQRSAQRDALDRFAGSDLSELIGNYQSCYSKYLHLTEQVALVHSAAQSSRLEHEQLLLALERIDLVDPQPGELDELQNEANRLGNLDQLESCSQLALALVAGDDGESVNALGLLEQAQRAVTTLESLDSDTDRIGQELTSATLLLSEIAGELSRYVDTLEAQPGRLAEVQARVASLTELTKLYGPSLADVLEWSRTAAIRVRELEQQLNPAAIQAELVETTQELTNLAADITEIRKSAATGFAARVTEELQGLMMANSKLTVQLDPIEFGPHGADQVSFLLSAHVGGEYLPIGEAASGGELSRVMLALEVVLAKTKASTTMVFDEIDAGVGGKAATQIGYRLARLGENSQVIVVTHLPQVAAFAARHLVVTKSSDGLVTTSNIGAVSGDKRIRELSRMLAGQEDSEAAAAHAKELLGLADELK